ncbi:MAG: hypothetical protein KGJ53_15570 [Alphaproteobacteria bacterium]|nr:hypothetical protein [Alphaproteobacteria bacterium]
MSPLPISQMQEAGKALEATQNELYVSLAKALDAWAVIEAHLCSIFAVAVTATDYSAAAAAFSAILSFEAQIDMVHASMGRRFAPNSPEYSSWKTIRKKLDKLRPARNRLAHGKVVPVVMKGGGMEFRYLPFYHFFTHKERDEFMHLTARDVKAIEAEFRGMIVAVHALGESIGAQQHIKSGKPLPR